MKKITYVILLMVFSWGGMQGTNGSVGTEIVDTAHPCSLTLEIPQAYQEELWAEKITVRLYRIADIASDGTYQDIAGYEELHLSELSSDVIASQLEKKAQETSAYLGVDVWKEKPDVAPEREFNIVNNYGIQTELETGLYLVSVKPFAVGKYTYQVSPYIICLPNQLEYVRSNTSLIYDLVVDLKIARRVKPTVPVEPVAPVEPLKEPSEEDISSSPDIVYKTGDDVKLSLLLGCVVFFGVSFCILCYMERRSRKGKK